jgi:outer membrane protein assembly factor BamB
MMLRVAFRVFFTLIVSLASVAALVAADGKKADPHDWPMWRGPEGNGISREKNLPDEWNLGDELWRSPELATRSTPIVLNGKLYTVCRFEPESTKEGEKVVCADIKTGKILWENVHNVFLTDSPAERVGWSSVVGDPATGHIFVHGLCGIMKCIDGETGKTIWEHSLMEEYGILSTYGGRTNFPVLFDDLVITSGVMTGWDDYAIPAHRYVAFKKATGEAVWIQSTKLRPEDTTYSTPFVTVVDGQAAIITGAGDGSVYAIQPRTGKIIFRYDASTRGINTPPIVVDGTVYCGHAEQMFKQPNVLGAVFAFKATGEGDITDKKATVWEVPQKTVGRSAPLFVDGRVYYADDGGKLFVIDAKTGKEITKRPYSLGRIMFSSAIYGDGKIYASEYGKFHILEPFAGGVKRMSEVSLPNAELIGSPIIAHGRVFIPTLEAMYCIGNKDWKPAADPIPAAPQEADAKADQKIAQVQVAPVEALLTSDKTANFSVNVFNAKGQPLETPQTVKFTVEGAGSIDASGKYSAPKADAGHVAAKITAEVEGIKSPIARVRTLPPLPWKFDISDKQVPITWIGARYRHQVREVDGDQALVKVTTIPKGTRSQLWMGQPELHDYTIQADFKSDIKNGKFGDAGVINQRYTLALMGAKQQLQVRSWVSRVELRFAKTIKFAWEPNKWYTMKLQSENKDDRVVLRGKVWPKGESEPSEWTIEAADLTPNKNGSPGLFGNASDAEIFIDNISVTPNQ